MTLRTLLGPASAKRGALWQVPRARGECLTFGPQGADVVLGHDDTWEGVTARLPGGWSPDCVILDLAYTTVPAWLWQAPLPLVALVPDGPLQWHFLREALPLCQLALSDQATVSAITRAGLCPAAQANLFGLQGDFLAPPPPGGKRDVDVSFVGNLHPAVQRDRLAWLGRLTRLGRRWRVHVTQGAHGADYQRLLLRSRVVFNRAARGEWNLRVGEAGWAGALLLTEARNPEVSASWRDGEDCAFYTDDTLEAVLEHYLSNEDERLRVAEAGRAKALACTYTAFWEEITRQVEEQLPALRERRARRPAQPPDRLLLARAWQALGAADGGDPPLLDDLTRAVSSPDAGPALLVSRGAVAALGGPADGPGRAGRLRACASDFHRACAQSPRHALAPYCLVEALAMLGQPELAAGGARRLLRRLADAVAPEDLEGALFPPGYSLFRVEWERAAFAHAGSPRAEVEAKAALLRWRLHALLASQTGELAHHHEAALARPDLPAARAALGCALARAGRAHDAVTHLEAAASADPFDRPAARACYQALADAGLAERAERFRSEQLALYLSAPTVVPAEAYFARPLAHQGEATPGREGALAVVWQGAFRERHSLALVNRRLVRGLVERGHDLSLAPVPTPGHLIEPGPEWALCEERLARPLGRPADVEVRHGWPPSLGEAPPEGRWVVIQPWEHGALPAAWLAPFRDRVDELWVPSSFVKAGFVQGGVPAEKVVVVPNGVDAGTFRPDVKPLPLPTTKRYKFLFVGGTIRRKGIDVLLSAYARAFSAHDDVCLVVKDMGAGTFYKGQTAEALLAELRARPGAPEVIHLDGDLSDAEMAALYGACDCLVHPYRGEGFGLPIAEAMSCGLPVIVTGHGAALDFCDEANAYLLPARVVRGAERRVAGLETVEPPWWAEPDGDALVELLRRVVARPEEGRAKGEVGRRRVLERLTWGHAVRLAEQRLRALCDRPADGAGHSGPMSFAGGRVAAHFGQRLLLHDPARDKHVSAPLLAGRGYEPYQVELALSLVGPGDVVVDVGANLGQYALPLAARVGPTGKVYAFEPDPDNLALLARSVELNGHANVALVPKAASDKGGTAKLYRSADNQGDQRLYGCAGRDSVEVETVRLDDYFGDPPPRVALVKMDVQGCEALALAGMRRLLGASPDVKVLCEHWPWGLEQAGTGAKALLDGLRGLGLSPSVLDERLRQARPVTAEELLRLVPVHEGAFVNLLWQRPSDAPFLVPARAYEPGVSLCVIARDEEHNIGACLDGAQGVFDEVIVVDTGSTDRTKEIARAKGAPVFDFPWVDSFSAARNACLEHATKRWVFWLDADDRLDAANREKLKALFVSLPDENVAYSMKCRCAAPPGAAETVVDHVRLFRNDPAVRWRYRIHEQILPAVRASGAEVLWADVEVYHTGYADPALRARKLQRDLRLLEIEYREQPHDPFTLFNLGATYQEMGRGAEALPLLQESLARSGPTDSIVRKLYSLIALGLRGQGRREEALRACLEGQRFCPDDTELLYQEGELRAELSDLHGAKAALLRLLGGGTPGGQFASVAQGLRGHMGRHQLAAVCARLGERDDAEGLYLAALREAPSSLPAWHGLAGLYLDWGRGEDFESAVARIEALSGGAPAAAWWRARAPYARRDLAAARASVEAALLRWPDDVPLLLLKSHVLIDQGDGGALAAVDDVLNRDPDNANARQNQQALHSRRGTA